jgi:xanthine dehydrogenase small subunit
VRHWPQLQEFAARFAGLPVRNSGTLGGNVANGSPIGDSMPVLIALGAEVVLASVRGERRIAIEDFYTGYRQNVLAPDELLVRIDVPLPRPGQLLRVYKVSKRFDDDISAVCLAVALELDGPEVVRARIGAGGVAATPASATAAEQVLLGQAWSQQAATTAGLALQAQFEPISDMRASGAYRRTLLANLMLRLWLESQAGGDTTVLTRVSAHGQDFSTPLTSAHR